MQLKAMLRACSALNAPGANAIHSSDRVVPLSQEGSLKPMLNSGGRGGATAAVYAHDANRRKVRMLVEMMPEMADCSMKVLAFMTSEQRDTIGKLHVEFEKHGQLNAEQDKKLERVALVLIERSQAWEKYEDGTADAAQIEYVENSLEWRVKLAHAALKAKGGDVSQLSPEHRTLLEGSHLFLLSLGKAAGWNMSKVSAELRERVQDAATKSGINVANAAAKAEGTWEGKRAGKPKAAAAQSSDGDGGGPAKVSAPPPPACLKGRAVLQSCPPRAVR